MDPAKLKVGEFYYRLTFATPDMLVPGLQPIVFVGSNILEPDQESDDCIYYFQDSVSFSQFGLATEVSSPNSEQCLLTPESRTSVLKSIVTLSEAKDQLENILSAKAKNGQS